MGSHNTKCQNRRIIVTGGAGFIGSHLVDQLIENGAEHIVVYDNLVRGKLQNLESALSSGKVTIIEGDIRDSAKLQEAINGNSLVFHLAALHLRRCENNPREALEVNELGSFNVAEACVKNGVEKLVASSSFSVYGEAESFPTEEEQVFNTRIFYGVAKVASELYFRAFHNKYGLNVVNLRYLNVYGPRQDYLGLYTEVVMHFIYSLFTGVRPVIHGEGTQTIDPVYVKDVARANVVAMESSAVNTSYNVSAESEITVMNLFNIIREIMESNIEPILQDDNLKLYTRRSGSGKKIRKELGFVPEIELNAGLRFVVDWFLKCPEIRQEGRENWKSRQATSCAAP